MNKAIFFIGLGIILLEILGIGGYILAQQSQEFVDTAVLITVIGGLNLVAIIMMLVGLLED